MACSKIFTAFILALVAKDKALSCSLRAHHNSGQPVSSTTDWTLIPNNTSATKGSSLTPNYNALNKTESIPLNDSSIQNSIKPLFVPEPPVESISTDENQVLMQLLLQRLPAMSTYEVPIQSPFSSPISVYQPTSNFPEHIKYALLQQQIDPSSTALKSQSSNVENIGLDSSNRMLPDLSSSPMLKNPIAISNAVPETRPIIAPDDSTTLNSNSPTSPTVVKSIFESEQQFINEPTPTAVLKNNDDSKHFTQTSSLPCLECNSSSSTSNYSS